MTKIIASYDGSNGGNEIAQKEFWRELEHFANFMHGLNTLAKLKILLNLEIKKLIQENEFAKRFRHQN